MPLAAGQSLSFYEILGPLGAGAMGEVYRAKDSRLDREVAIKVLPEHFAEDEERLIRFEREAKSLASLNHPNVAQIFGVDQVDDTCFLVLELVPGETLEDRIARGALPLDEALDVCCQIADGLEAAHEAGVIHRDLKPANVRITPDGRVKVLDFGLAKPVGEEKGSASSTDSVLATEQGRLLGTPTYMAPEQARGKHIDRRIDVWAFGCVLFECLTASRAYVGETLLDVLSAVLQDEPDWTRLPATTPAHVRSVLARCLVKEPRKRLRDVGDAALMLREAGDADEVVAPVMVKRKTRERLAWAVGALLLLTSLAVGWVALDRGRQLEDRQRIEVSISPPPGGKFETYGSNIGSITLSPDGRWVTFAGSGPGGRTMLFVRPLDSGVAQPLAGTEGVTFPFWAPDSRQVGFFAGGKLKKIDRSGGAALTICSAQDARGGTWNRDGVVVFAANTRVGLSRVSAAGGTATEITSLDRSAGQTSHRFPAFLPDGEHFLYIGANHEVPNNDEANAIWVGSLNSGEPVRIMQSGSAAAYSQGHLLNVRDGFLMARAFDPKYLIVTGEAFAVSEGVGFLASYFRGAFAVSENGLLAFQGGIQGSAQLTWMDRNGNRLGTLGDLGRYERIRLSPDETKLAAGLHDPATGSLDLWVFDVERNVKSRLTFDEANDSLPVWSPDGTRIVFSSGRTSSGDLYSRQANGSGNAELIWETEGSAQPEDWSPDGRYIAANRSTADGGYDLWILPVSGDEEPYGLVTSDFDVGYARFSPDGEWLAYLSNESGQYEMYVTRFPGGEGKWQVSANGADWVVGWKRDGSEIYFMDPEGKVAAVQVRLGEGVVADLPQTLFPTQSNDTWAAAGSGEKFLVAAPESTERNFPITLVINWLASR
ncbi:MAG: serine/threonine protein kinase [Planctomycetota bacterium]|jgi:serine/threonine protein kinase